jgi:protein O-mannosyl-transferase
VAFSLGGGFRKLTLVGALAIAVVVLVVYFPAFRIGFYLDDWGYMESVGRLGPSAFALRSIDPRTPDFLYTYRPLQGLLLAIEYPVFGKDSTGYHLVHIGLHLVNSLLLWLIVRQLGQTHRTAFLAGLFFASYAVSSFSVFLPSAQDVLAAFFYLIAIWSWLTSLQTGSKRYYALTITAFVLGLLTKEIVATLPVALFVADRFFIKDTAPIAKLFRRYFLIVAVLLFYAVFEFNIQPKATLGGIYRMGHT